MATILNHGPRLHQRPRLWMFAGTGEGPRLAAQLLQQGWALRVSVVSPAAARPYRPLLAGGALELQVGSLAGAEALLAQLALERSQGQPFAAVIDATHPFATQISGSLQRACRRQGQLLLRLGRESPTRPGATMLNDLDALRALDLRGERLLLAIGARHLRQAVACSPGALHHARVLPAAEGLQLAHGAGLRAERIACLRPSSDFAVEQALVRRWRISTILCRQSGGLTEAGWSCVAAGQGCRLLLLARPETAQHPLSIEALSIEALSIDVLLAKLGGLRLEQGGGSNNSGGDVGPHH